MKSFVLFGIVLGIMASRLDAQIPKKVLNSFTSRYQASENVKWSAIEGIYKASFKHLEQSKIAFYKTDGTWVKTNIYISPEELTFCIKDFIRQEYFGTKVVKADLIRTPTSLKYYIDIEYVNSKPQEDNKTHEKTTLIFDEQCGFLGKQERQ